ncbi:MAG: hypothetical protein QOJ27_2388 [Sphingomonadales bacterium]|nr:hypothetical protein [Sphingomonadales bacterium]
MPTTAQDRDRRGPLAALLILLSLFLAAGTAAAGSDVRGPAARFGSNRHNASTALLPPGARNLADDEMSGAGDDPSPVPSAPGIVTERLWERPLAEVASPERGSVPRPPSASYRARAPPAS